jgi:ribosomal RNA-processing protein 12
LCQSPFTDTTPNRRRKPGQDAHHFKIDSDTGKMVINDGNESDNEATTMADIAGSAYQEAITSVDGFSREPNGRIKFNKNTKKRRREVVDIEDDKHEDVNGDALKSKKNMRKADVRLGHEFKAKVCNL